MMIVAPLLMLVAMQTQPATELKTFESRTVGLSFSYPSTWKVEKTKVANVFTLPVAGGQARVELFDTDFRDTVEKWNETQTRVNETMGRKVERQWQEEILGVPMLMTKLSFAEKGLPRNLLDGLLYSATQRKLHFRLSSDPADYEQAESSWRNVLLTLRTLDGSLPTKEDPTKPIEDKPKPKPAEAKPTPAAPPVVMTPFDNQGKRFKLGPVIVPAKASAKDVVLRLPEGWTATPSGDTFTVKRNGLLGEVTIEVLGTLDSPVPERTLIARSAKTLDDFVSIASRIESRPMLTRSGSWLLTVRRTGKTAEVERTEIHATGQKGDFYWLVYYRTPTASAEADRKWIVELLEGASVEIAQP